MDWKYSAEIFAYLNSFIYLFIFMDLSAVLLCFVLLLFVYFYFIIPGEIYSCSYLCYPFSMWTHSITEAWTSHLREISRIKPSDMFVSLCCPDCVMMTFTLLLLLKGLLEFFCCLTEFCTRCISFCCDASLRNSHPNAFAWGHLFTFLVYSSSPQALQFVATSAVLL